MSDPDPGLYDLFVSYSARDDVVPPGEHDGWVQAFVRRVRELARPFTSQDLVTPADREPDWATFYAPDEIHAGQSWETRLRTAVAHSRVLLACLSEHYWESKWCRIEWETYLQHEAARGLANVEGGITPIYIATAPGVKTADIVAAAPEWARALLRTRQAQLLPFETHGADALARIHALREDANIVGRLTRVAERVSKQIQLARTHEGLASQGNLAPGTDTFVGREDELARIEGQLFGGGALGVITALRGLGGQGKTALALRYGQNLRSRYSGGTWQVIAEGSPELLPLIAGLRESLALPAIATEDETGTAVRVLAELRRRAFDPTHARGPGHPAAALLVVDNVDDARLLAQKQRDLLREALQRAGSGPEHGWLHLLATTRLEARDLSFLPREHIIPVDALPLAQALGLWKRLLAGLDGTYADTELQAAHEIITLLERHTLAVEVAARHIRRSEETAGSYLARLRQALATAGGAAGALAEQQHGLEGAEILPGYTHALEATLGFTFDHLQAEDPAAATVLHFAAHFPAEAVPLPWLRRLAGQTHSELRAEPEAAGVTTAWDRVQLRLTQSLRLLTHADGEHEAVWRMHRLAGSFLRHRAREAGEDEARVDAVEAWISQRAEWAERDHRRQLDPWERAVLLADLPARLRRDDRPAKIGRAAGVLIDTLGSYADLATAHRLAVDQLELFQRVAASDPANAEWQRDLSLSLERLGDLAVRKGDLSGAKRCFTRSRSIRERLAASDPANADRQRDLSVLLNKLGELAVAQGGMAEAKCCFKEATAIAQRLVTSDPTNAEWQRDLSLSLERLGALSVVEGDLAAAERCFKEGTSIRERLVASDPTNARWRHDLSVLLNRLGDLSMAKDDLVGAERYFKEATAIAQRLVATDPANADWQRELSVSLNKLGDLSMAKDDLVGAERYFKEAMAIAQHLVATDPANVEWQRDLSVSLNRLGDLAVAQGDLARAEHCFEEARATMGRLAASDPVNAEWQRDLSLLLNRLGDVAVAQGDLAAAERCFKESKRISERLAANDPANAAWQRDLSASHFKLYKVARAKGDAEAAESSLRACYDVLRGMKQRGLHFDPQLASFYEQLREHFE